MSSDIFISYAREDRDRVQPIAEALQQRGYGVWWDKELRSGEDYRDRIEEMLQTAKCVVVAWSRHSVESDFVIDQADVGKGREVLLPVCIDEGIEPPLGFRAIFTTDLSGWQGGASDPTFERFARGVTTRVAHSGKPGSTPRMTPAERIIGWVKALKKDRRPRQRAVAPAPSPAPTVPAAGPKSGRKGVFISYSHEDAEWLERLQTHLRPLERDGVVVWDDTRLRPGEPWREEIRKAMAETKVAILLVSADFLASDFIATDELPPLLKAAAEDGATILPVIISPSRFKRTESLSVFQTVNDPENPLINLRRGDREKVLNQVADAVEDALKQ